MERTRKNTDNNWITNNSSLARHAMYSKHVVRHVLLDALHLLASLRVVGCLGCSLPRGCKSWGQATTGNQSFLLCSHAAAATAVQWDSKGGMSLSRFLLPFTLHVNHCFAFHSLPHSSVVRMCEVTCCCLDHDVNYTCTTLVTIKVMCFSLGRRICGASLHVHKNSSITLDSEGFSRHKLSSWVTCSVENVT